MIRIMMGHEHKRGTLWRRGNLWELKYTER
jgi:hypothetical protein